jgi:hypothetical protein
LERRSAVPGAAGVALVRDPVAAPERLLHLERAGVGVEAEALIKNRPRLPQKLDKNVVRMP